MDKNLIIRKSQYVMGGVCLDLFHRLEGPYATITTCLPGVTSNEVIALNHDLENYNPDLATELVGYLTEGKIGEQQVGFVTFKLYKLKKGILDTLEEKYRW